MINNNDINIHHYFIYIYVSIKTIKTVKNSENNIKLIIINNE